MSTYIIYNNNTGEILNVHREYLQGSTETLEFFASFHIPDDHSAIEQASHHALMRYFPRLRD